MKKIILILAIAGVIFTIHSCKKNALENQVPNNDEMITNSQKVIALIKDFKSKMENNLKSGEMITSDSAVWYLEATLNYQYAHPDSLTAEYFTEKSFFTITVDAAGLVSIDEVQTVYGLMEDTLLAQYGAILNSYKVVSFSDVAMDSVVGNTGYMSVTNGFGVDPPRNYVPFDEDDDWIWGTLGEEYGDPPAGKCDGTEVGISDGSNELRWRLNNPMPVPGEQIFYTDLVTLEATGWDFEDENGNPRLYVGWNYPEDNCLTNDTLTYYLNQSDDIIYTYDYNGGLRPPTKDFVRVEIIDDLKLEWQNDQYYHLYYVTYGIPNSAPSGE